MATSKGQRASMMASPDDIEAQFYEALQQGDLDRLMRLWADEEDITCVHPGGPRVIGAPAIRASFDAMFANGTINARPERVRRVHTLTSAVHNVVERVQVMTEDGLHSAYVIATNVYVKTPQGWRMVVHHASPGTPREAPEVTDSPSVLH